jgi:hypothetical protein
VDETDQPPHPDVTALGIECPRCGALAGRRCLRAPGEPDGITHVPRLAAAGDHTPPRSRAHNGRVGRREQSVAVTHGQINVTKALRALAFAARDGNAWRVANLERKLDAAILGEPWDPG